MYKLGITGGIGSGKSTAAEFFMQKGAVVFDADVEAKHHIQKTESVQKLIIHNFGSQITTDNHLDLNKLSKIAFSSDKNQKILNGIVWPEVSLLMYNAAYKAENKCVKLFIVDAALLLEVRFTKFFNSILLITADESVRYNRILLRENIPEDQIEKRMAFQMPESQKKKLAHTTIENNGDVPELYTKLELFWEGLNIV